MSYKEIVVISGKGGTGKTTVTASLIPYLDNITIADCDVDAPDLDIILEPECIYKEDFIGTNKAVIDIKSCTNCGLCTTVCNFNAIITGYNYPIVKEVSCEGCNTCTLVCKSNSITLKPYKTGELFNSETTYGPMIHARLTPGEEVSGRLVSEVRKKAKDKAIETNSDIVLIDGPPGIACNMISSVTGVNLAIIITEPTISGLHDLKRVYETLYKLNIKCGVIINKNGLSEIYTNKIEEYCNSYNIIVLGHIPLSEIIIKSINNKKIPSIENMGFFNKNGWKSTIRNIKNIIYSDLDSMNS